MPPDPLLAGNESTLAKPISVCVCTKLHSGKKIKDNQTNQKSCVRVILELLHHCQLLLQINTLYHSSEVKLFVCYKRLLAAGNSSCDHNRRATISQQDQQLYLGVTGWKEQGAVLFQLEIYISS